MSPTVQANRYHEGLSNCKKWYHATCIHTRNPTSLIKYKPGIAIIADDLQLLYCS